MKKRSALNVVFASVTFTVTVAVSGCGDTSSAELSTPPSSGKTSACASYQGANPPLAEFVANFTSFSEHLYDAQPAATRSTTTKAEWTSSDVRRIYERPTPQTPSIAELFGRMPEGGAANYTASECADRIGNVTPGASASTGLFGGAPNGDDAYFQNPPPAATLYQGLVLCSQLITAASGEQAESVSGQSIATVTRAALCP